MSTASAPVSASACREAPPATRGTDTIGPRCTVCPARRNSPASSGADGQATAAPVRAAHLGRDDEVARAHARPEAAADAGDQDRPVAEPRGGRDASGAAHSGVDGRGGRRGHRRPLHPQRRADHRAGRHDDPAT